MNSNRPPSFFLRIFRWFCHPDILTPIEGDLMELYDERVEKNGKRIADLRFIIDVIQLLRPGILRPMEGSLKINYYDMFKHNIILTLRNFRRYKSSFLINLVGLSTGIATFLLIYLWVSDEVSKDHFHENDQSLYQVLRNIKLSDQSIATAESNSDLLVPALREEISEIATATILMEDISSAILTYEGSKIKTVGKHAGKDFFNVFSYPLLSGDPNSVLQGKSSIVISKSLAERLLGTSDNVIGQSIHLLDNTDGDVEYEGNYLITGVFDLEGVNTSEEFDFLLTDELFLANRDQGDTHWDSNSSNVYVVLKDQVNLPLLQEKLDKFYRSKMGENYIKYQMEGHAAMFVQKYSDRYLYNRYENGQNAGGRIQYVHLFSIIACIILLIACINFINLSTALASRRTKELGIKKVMGASKSNLIFQYLSESILLTFISSLVAIVIVFLALPYFNALTDKSLTLKIDLNFIQYALLFIVTVGLLSGSYPSVFLSGLKIIEALKTRLKTSFSEIIVRKGLIIFQFCISTVLIISVLVIGQQIDYIQSKNLGFEMDNILLIEKEGKLVRNIDPFMAEVRNTPGVLNATILEGSPVSFDNSGGGYGSKERPPMQFTFAPVGYDYIKTMGIKLKEGRAFSREFSNEGQKIILNETAIKRMGLENPIGTVVNIRGNREIIGIVEDFHYQSLHNEIKPMFLIYQPGDANSIVVKIKAGNEKQSVASIEKIYKKYNPALAFNFRFLNNEYDQLYNSEMKVAGLSKYFALIAVLISCLGLFGLATFSTERRIKEIGIRKILGAGSFRIVLMLTSSFTKMVVVAIVIAIPVAHQILGGWLDNFAYRISLGWSYFFIGASAALLIACFTVGYQTWSAADVDPVKCIRDE